MDKLITQLTELKNSIPPAERAVFLRARLLSRIRFYQFKQSKYSGMESGFIFLRRFFAPARLANSFVAVSLVAFLVIGLSVGTVVAANFTDPGEALYGIKLTLERVPLVFPIKEENKVRKELSLVLARQREIVTIMNSGDSSEIKSKKITQVAEQLSKNIESTQKRVQKISQEESESAVVMQAASSFKASVVDVQKSLNRASQVVTAESIDHNTSNTLQEVTQQASEAEFSALGVLIGVVSKPESPIIANDLQIAVGQEDSQSAPSVEEVQSKSTAGTNGTADQENQSSNVVPNNQNSQINELAEETVLSITLPTVEQEISESQAATPVNILTSEVLPVDSERLIIKSEVVQDLKKTIDELERQILSLINQASEEADNSTAVEAPTASPEVILNVNHLLDRQALSSKILALLKNAREKVAKDDLNSALQDVDNARQLIKRLVSPL